MNGAEFLHVQVSYRQGVVKDFVAPREMLAGDFADQAKRHGRPRSLRFREDVSAAGADELVRSGAVMMRVPQ